MPKVTKLACTRPQPQVWPSTNSRLSLLLTGLFIQQTYARPPLPLSNNHETSRAPGQASQVPEKRGTIMLLTELSYELSLLTGL